MIIVADGGSTKCDWFVVSKNDQSKYRTKGVNPAQLKKGAILKRINENQDLLNVKDQIQKVYFYGAGCGTDKNIAKLKTVLVSFFEKAEKVVVQEDTVGAVYATTPNEPGLVCIMGTGSNTCYFDGKKIESRFPSIGFLIMDEAGGNFFGKRLLHDYFYNIMPDDIASEFEYKYDLDPDVVKNNLYLKPNPTAYLASFADFLLSKERNKYFSDIIYDGIDLLFKRRILNHPNCRKFKIHFVGSVAYFMAEELKSYCNDNDLKFGNIIRRPIDNLVKYHLKEID